MLYLIGLGLHGDLSLEGLKIARRSRVCIELYTSFLTVSLENLEQLLQKKITVLTRKEVEETQEFLKIAKDEEVALLVVGDPLVATTHAEIVIEARKQKICTKIIHNSSIYSAIAETGLQIYKFGKTVTIPFPQEGYQPVSFFETIQKNQTMGAHTLVLLDILQDQKKYMNPGQAMKILHGLGFNGDVLCVSRLGSNDQRIVYGSSADLLSLGDEYWGSPPHCLVIPSSLHFKEEEFLESYRGAS